MIIADEKELENTKRNVDEHYTEIKPTFFWTESTTVWQWLYQADKEATGVVANTEAEILDNSIFDQWRHSKGTVNPAVIGTRGKSVHELRKIELITGPAWLRE